MKRSRRVDASERGELRIEGLGTGGEGLAHVDGVPLFLPGTLPGERVRARWQRHGKQLRGELLDVLEPHGDRKAPECADAGACGGCDWMHMQIPAQRREHAARLERLLGTSVGHHEAADALGTRHRMRMHVESRGARVEVGYFRARSSQLLVPTRCHAVAPALDQARRHVADALAAQRGIAGELTLSLCPDGSVVADLTLTAGEPSATAVRAFDALVQQHTLAGLRVRLPGGGAPLLFGDPTPITEAADGLPLRLALGGFAQSAPAMSRALGARMLGAIESLQLDARARVVEVHAGAGNFSVLLARRFHELATYEVSASAAAAARHALAERGLSAKVHVAAAESIQLPNRLPLLVLDPPREGARELVQHARDRRTRALLYVSCEPTTLARDRNLLGEDYTLERLEAFEMFPQTSHVETLALLVRRTP